MAVLTGQGTASAAATIMALGLDPRFDFSHAYWIIAGIAGGNPERVSLGSAAWARWVVDGDLGYEIDSREMPTDWPTGYLPLRRKTPYEQPAEPLPGQVFELNAGLAGWAFDLTRDTPLEDSDHLKEIRAAFDGAARAAPSFRHHGRRGFVVHLLAWQAARRMGQRMDALLHRRQRHVRHHSDGRHGHARVHAFLANAGRIDSIECWCFGQCHNFDQQPRGLNAAESLARQRIGAYGAYLPSLEAAYRIGHVVVRHC